VQDRSDITDTVLDRYINNAYRTISTGKFVDITGQIRTLRFPELELRQDASLSTGTETYALMDRTYAIIVVSHQYDTGPPARWLNLKYLAPAKYTEIPVTEQRPYFYTFFHNAIRIRPVPSSDWNGTTLRIWSYVLPTPLTGVAETPVIQPHWHHLISVLAASRLAGRFGFTELATDYEAEFKNILSTMPTPYEMQSHISATRVVNNG
jgi:hypothetical protein